MEEVRAALTQEVPPSAAVVGPSIAVLPFVSLSSDKENEFFADNLTEEVINSLSQISALKVAARTSSFAFRDKEQDIRKVAQVLSVGTVLEGSVRKSMDRIRVTVQLMTPVTAASYGRNVSIAASKTCSPFRTKSPAPPPPR